MTKSELIERLAESQSQLTAKDMELAVKLILDQMADSLARGERVEIRGFGSVSLHYRAPRVAFFLNPHKGFAKVFQSQVDQGASLERVEQLESSS